MDEKLFAGVPILAAEFINSDVRGDAAYRQGIWDESFETFFYENRGGYAHEQVVLVSTL